MNIMVPDVISAAQAEQDVFVNVFNGSERSTVEMRLDNDGDWTPMTRQVVIDPSFQQVVEAERAIKDKTWRELPKPVASTHLWQAKLPAATLGSHLLHVRTTDMHGRTYHARRVIRVAPPTVAAGGEASPSREAN
jgi:hypothetical protein